LPCVNIGNFIVKKIIVGYHAATITCCILALDRLFILIFPEVSKKLFGGKMVYFWILLPIVYVLIFSTQDSDIYTSTVHAYHFDPYIGAQGLGSNPRVKKSHACLKNYKI
jgi:hypothetical protein